MFFRVDIRLIELKALLASTSRAASVSSSWKLSRTECTAASHPDIWPAYSCAEPAASCTSSLITARTAFAMIRLAVSPMPMGRTPGHLSRAISLQARKGASPRGSRCEMQRRFAKSASAWHRSSEAVLKAVHNLLQAWASNPDGPAAPLTLSEVERIRRASMLSKMIGWSSVTGPSKVASGEAGWPGGCLLARTSLTDVELGSSWFICCSNWSNPPLPLLASRSRAAWVFPWNIRLANFRASFSSFVLSFLETLGRRRWIVLPSLVRASRSPSFQSSSLLTRQLAFPFAFDLLCGRCRSRIGRTMVAISAMGSSTLPEAKALYSLASSATKDFPALPNGTWKLFFLQSVTFS